MLAPLLRQSLIAICLCVLVAACKKSEDTEAAEPQTEEGARQEIPATGPAVATRPAPPETPDSGTGVNAGGQKVGAPGAGNQVPSGGSVQSQAPQVAPPPPAPLPHAVSRPPMPDLKLLLTARDVSEMTGGKTSFKRTTLPGVAPSEDYDCIYYEPEKGSNYGLGIQVFRGATPDQTRERYASMLASYPSAVEIQPVAGKTFFAWWDEVLFVVFVQPAKNLVVVLSCGRKHCDSDRLYELARKVATRAG